MRETQLLTKREGEQLFCRAPKGGVDSEKSAMEVPGGMEEMARNIAANSAVAIWSGLG
jgi:hypothetical protein